MKQLILILIVLLPMSILAGGFGSEAVGGLSLTVEGDILGIESAADSTGTLDSVKVYLDITVAAKDCHCAVYKKSDTSLIDSSEVLNVGVSTAWNYLDFLLGGQVIEDTVYYIVVCCEIGDGNGRAYFGISGDPWAREENALFVAWEDPWVGRTTLANRPISIFAYYTTAVSEVGQVIIIQAE
jgi:hypothetical protein